VYSQYYNVSVRSYNYQYSQGRFDYLELSTYEMARNSIVVLFINKHKPNGTILDVGCGLGATAHLLTPEQKATKYLGFDFSEVAISLAREKHPTAKFKVATFQNFKCDVKFDSIIFNEMIMYTKHLDLLRQYENCLAPDGILVVSIWFNENKPTMYKEVFNDIISVYDQVEEIYLQGITVKLRGQKMLVNERIGAFKVRNTK
jgi:trans-aconitate methyltransferase